MKCSDILHVIQLALRLAHAIPTLQIRKDGEVTCLNSYSLSAAKSWFEPMPQNPMTFYVFLLSHTWDDAVIVTIVQRLVFLLLAS